VKACSGPVRRRSTLARTSSTVTASRVGRALVSGRPSSDPQERRRPRNTDQSGNFKLAGLPPEDYLVAALEFLEPGDERDPDLLERLRPAATAVSITEGASKTLTLKLSR
jgi:hypothetical protein